MTVKEVLTDQKAEANIEEAKSDPKKLESYFKEKAYERHKKKIAKYWAPLILKQSPKYNLTYDSFSEGLEPVYYWLLDFMQDPAPGGLGLAVSKSKDDTEAGASSGYFGETGARATQMQKNATEFLGTINQVIKSILNLLYDLKEFEIKLEAYDGLKSKDSTSKEAALRTLKAIWMDQVDIKKGKGSLNMLAQDLKFVTIRDGFFYANNAKAAKGLDLNDRVKGMLIQRLDEFDKWRKHSEIEIRKRFQIERAYLKEQVGTLKLYAGWVKPYLKAAQKLRMKEFNSAHVVNAFSNIEMELEMWGEKEITHAKVQGVSDKAKKLDMDSRFAAVIVNLHFRSVPQSMQGQGGRHYVHGGRVEIKITPLSLSKLEKEALELRELYEDMELVEEWVGTTLEHMQDEISKYLHPSEEDAPKIERTKQKFDNPFSGLTDGFKDIFGFSFKKTFKTKKEKGEEFLKPKLSKLAKKEADGLADKLYFTYKKTHGMLAW